MTLNPRHLFLIDGIGALVTAAILLGVLAQFESTFGMPSRVVYVLAAIAAGFAVYSLTCYLKQPTNWPPFLRAIAIANLSYCFLTVMLIVVFRNEVRTLGIAYFAAEIIIVSTLAIYEMIIARRVADR